MKIYIGADHAGYNLKNLILSKDQEIGFEFEDVGAYRMNLDDDYPEYAQIVSQKVISNPGSLGLLICRNGVGVNIAANKVDGIRSVNTHEHNIAISSKNDDDTNILCLGADYIDLDDSIELIKAWAKTPFSLKERHFRRIEMIKEIESSN